MKTKGIKKTKINILLILLGLIVAIGIIVFVANSKQEIEQYYIDGKHYIQQEKDNKLGIAINYKPGQVINSYADYISIFEDNDEVFTLLEDAVDQNFFNNKSLIILEDSTNSVRGIDGHISKINIKNNIANITIRRDKREYGSVVGDIRTYFIPVNNKNITEVNRKYKFPFEFF